MASTEFYCDFSKGQPFTDLKLEGDAHYINGALRFTKTDDQGNPVQWSTGRAVYDEPVVFKLGDKVANFEIEVQFKVTVPIGNTRYGDGLAFFIVPEGYKYPTFGILGSPGVFAVVFDIDSQIPGYIKLGICISERTPKSYVTLPADLLLRAIKLRVSYDSAIKLIRASVSNVEDGNKTFSVSCTYDLSHFLPPKVEVGFGSSTSEYVALHDAFSWSFNFDTPTATS